MEVQSIGGIILLEGNRNTRGKKKPCTSASLSTTNPTRGGSHSDGTFCRILKECSVNKHWRNMQLLLL